MLQTNDVVWRSCLIFGLVLGAAAKLEWQARDAFDEIKEQMDRVSGDNCQIQDAKDLFLSEETVSHLPDIREFNINPTFPNRTDLRQLHNIALSRSFFWSYILQSRLNKPAVTDTHDPGMMYYFLSTVADVSANPKINAGAVYFAPHNSYSPSYREFFNKTFPRFAPRTYRLDSFKDPSHLFMNTFDVRDLGAIPNNAQSTDYSTEFYKINEWYRKWLPDNDDKRHDTKTTYQVEIQYENNTSEKFIFYGPPGADDTPGPIKFTRPYFDCGRSNKWLVAAVSPIVDIFPRHTQFRHIEYPRYTGISVLEMDFDRIDINQCPKGVGNEGPNKFAGTSRCKTETTDCEPLHGWGFHRGGYQCRCRPQFRRPEINRRPFLGEVLEKATDEEYNNGFNCLKIGSVQKLPINWDKLPSNIRNKYLDIHHEYKNHSTGANSVHDERLNVDEVLKFILGVNQRNCKNYSPEELVLTDDFSFGAHEQFENEAKMAVRLANFISAFLQITDPNEIYSGTRVPDQPLTEDQIIGETLALVLGNNRIWSAGTYWGMNKFTDRTYFAPFAYKTEINTRKVKVDDLARLIKSGEIYTEKPWFKFMKEKWSVDFDSLEKFNMKMQIRHNETGEHLQNFEHYPNFYQAANINQGHWTSPVFDCNGFVKQWLITYAAPFFGWDSSKSKLEFKGAVAVTMDLWPLDINQCPDSDHVPNAFKNSHKCDELSTYCVPILGRGYDVGGYKCECREGFEYPFEDQITYYDGQLIEAEFQSVVNNENSRYDMFKCRPVIAE